jgi:hypothetical protein
MYIIILIIIVLLFICSYKLKYLQNNNTAFCLLTFTPNDIWIDFLSKTIDYDIYVFIDDNSMIYKSPYSNIKFIQYKDEECYEKSWYDVNFIIKKDVTAWDKALYYFATINKSYEHVWFCEDDVFIPDMNLLTQIDNKYNNVDLICKEHIINNKGLDIEDGWPHWHTATKTFNLPWAHSMQCICRMSKTLLSKINDYVIKNKKLEFLETLFSTLAHQHKLNIENPRELNKITWRDVFDYDTLDTNFIYHPMKNIDDHKLLRDKKTVSQ